MFNPISAVRPLTSAPPLFFVVLWNGFVTAHAVFMLSGLRDKPMLLAGLVVFYSLFFGVGGFMARSWWRVRSFQRRFGSPSVQSLTPVRPGQPFTISLRFDRAWPSGQRLEGWLHWVEQAEDESRSVASQPVSSIIQLHPQGTVWQATNAVLSPPGMLHPNTLRLELRLPDPAGGPAGWAVSLPLNAGTDAPSDLNGLRGRALTPADREKLLKVLGRLPSALLWGAGLMLALMSLDRRLDFTDLLFPIFLGTVGWYLRAFRKLVEEKRGGDLSLFDTAALKRRFRDAGILLPLVMAAAFAADTLLPGDVFQTLRVLASIGVERTQAPDSGR